MSLLQEKRYKEEDYYNLPEDIRAEIIDGQIYYHSAPSRIHQEVLMELSGTIREYIKSRGGTCKVYPAPFAVKLNKDKNIVEPDISVICDKDKLTDKGCTGAPDWIIEIVSPGNPGHDYIKKLNLYQAEGVKEYWIVNPQKKIITVYYFLEENFSPDQYSFEDSIKVNIYDDFIIDFKEIDLEL